MNKRSKCESGALSLLVSLLVLMMMMMMSLSWACLGREGTRYPSFQHCVFHRETGGARGLWLNFASLPRPPSLSPHPSSSLSSSSVSVTFWLQRWLCLNVLSFPSPACCHVLSPFSCNVTSSHSLHLSHCLFSVSLPLSPDEIWGVIGTRNGKKCVCIWASFPQHISCACVCVPKGRSERWIEVSSSQQEINIRMAMLGLKTLGLLTNHKNSCSNI